MTGTGKPTNLRSETAVQRWYIWAAALILILAIQGSCPDAVSSSQNFSWEPPQNDVERWSKKIFTAEGKDLAVYLIRRGEAYRTLGHYAKAEEDFQKAQSLTEQGKWRILEVLATQSLGYIYHLQLMPKLAEPLLQEALESARILEENRLIAACANRLGTVLYAQDRLQEASKIFGTAQKAAQRANDPGLEAAILRNSARLEDDSDTEFKLLQNAYERTQEMISPKEQARLLLEIAHEAGLRDKEYNRLKFRYEALSRAATLAAEAKAPRLISLSAGETGRLYEIRKRYKEALVLTDEALEAARAANAKDLILKWEWQRGRLLKATGMDEEAVSVLRRAVGLIEEIRQGIEGCTAFGADLFPIYLDLADLLLRRAGTEKDPVTEQNLLKEAQQTVESMKQSQLRDYFKDPCIDALTQGVESLSSGTAVLYPIIFQDRLEILCDIRGQLYRRTIQMEKSELEKAIMDLAYRLRYRMPYQELSQKIYAWLMTPVEKLLEDQNVEMLVFVPDGAFRMLPIAALHDGSMFLAEKYAVATEPGLSLLDPKPLPRGDMKTMLAGLSTPGPVVMELPENFWNIMAEGDSSQNDRGGRGISVKTDALRGKIDGHKGSEKTRVEEIRKRLALPGVEKEIQMLSQSLPNETMLNDDFLLQRFFSQLRQQNFRVVHIASHGFFGGTPEQNFIMAFDKCLHMNHLENAIKPKQLADQPVELITLSACQTAEGDARSPLGLAGVALKSGARSVIGSLWPVSDAATPKLLSAFYQNLKSPDITKAQALRLAQLSFIKGTEKTLKEQNNGSQRGKISWKEKAPTTLSGSDSKTYPNALFRHPYYWAPFILIGNWL